ncbi:MAG: ROK family protein [Lachnospiraceae bacterium]|nr:ROK family protein [Lachnospiraceae bacterium]
MRIGAVEAGGTKIICAVVNEKGEILERGRIDTLTPDETMPEIIRFFRGKEIEALGVACFGPIDLNRESETYGYILKTTKLEWIDHDFLTPLKKEFGIPVGFDTDVNGSVLGEVTFGSSRGMKDVVYITIGTGVGMGVYTGGVLLHGAAHPEAGHIRLTRHPKDDYAGCCKYHGSCIEGLASGSAMRGRWKKRGEELSDNDEAWELEAFYLAQTVCDLTYTYAPQRIIMGGGIMHKDGLISMVKKETLRQNDGYSVLISADTIDDYLVLPSLKDDQGILGAAVLGLEALKEMG